MIGESINAIKETISYFVRRSKEKQENKDRNVVFFRELASIIDENLSQLKGLNNEDLAHSFSTSLYNIGEGIKNIDTDGLDGKAINEKYKILDILDQFGNEIFDVEYIDKGDHFEEKDHVNDYNVSLSLRSLSDLSLYIKSEINNQIK